MRWSVTKEIVRKEDGGRGGSDPGLGVKTQYRFELAFSRWSFKKRAIVSPERAAPESRPLEQTQKYHFCYDCGSIRSTEYHNQYLLHRGQRPRPNLCTLCRHDRKVRLDAGARRRGQHSHRSRKCRACIDDWQWCSNCGTLRSAGYHEKYMSGSGLPPWAEVCGKCVMTMEEQKGRCEELRARLELLDIREDRASSKRCDPVPQDNPPNRRSRPYVFKPVSLTKVECIPRSISSISTLLEATLSVDKNNHKQHSTTKSRSDFVTNSLDMSAEPESKPSICDAIVKEGIDTSVNDYQPVEKPQMPSNEQSEPPGPALQQEQSNTLPEQSEEKSKEKPKEKPATQRSEPRMKAAQVPTDTTMDDHKERHSNFPNQEKQDPMCKPSFKSSKYKFRPHSQPHFQSQTQQDQAQHYQEQQYQAHYRQAQHYPEPDYQEQQHQAQHYQACYHQAQHYQEQHHQAQHHQAQHHQSEHEQAQQYQEQHHQAQHHQAQHHQTQHQQAQHHWEQHHWDQHCWEQHYWDRCHQEQHNQEQQHQPQAAKRPMGISDMYWASPEGQAELAHSFVAGGYFFPGSVFNPSYYGFGADVDGASRPSTASDTARSSFDFGHADPSSSRPSTGYTTPATESTTYGGMSQQERKNQQKEQQKMQKVWEVDSDEEEEIEKSRAKLLAHCNA